MKCKKYNKSSIFDMKKYSWFSLKKDTCGDRYMYVYYTYMTLVKYNKLIKNYLEKFGLCIIT